MKDLLFLAPQTLKTYFFYFGNLLFLALKTLKTYSFFKNLLLLFKCEGGLGPLVYSQNRTKIIAS